MSKYPSNKEYLELARQWKKNQVKLEGAKTSATKNKYIRLRNYYAEKVLNGLEHLIINKAAKIFKTDVEIREDGINQARYSVCASALPKWDENKAAEKGAKFVSYMMLWVTQAMRRVRDADTIVNVPVNKRNAALTRLMKDESEEDDYLLLPSYSGWNQTVTRQEDSPATLGDKLNYEFNYTPGSEVEELCERQELLHLREAIDNISSETHRKIVKLRLKGMLFREIADVVGYSSNWVQLVHQQTIDRLTKTMRRRYTKELR